MQIDLVYGGHCRSRCSFPNLIIRQMAEDDPVKIPIDGVLDLHAFSPKDVKDLVPEYIRECRNQGIYHVRIIHGKGIGTLREIVHNLLEKDPHVLRFRMALSDGGNWGATEVELQRA